MSNRKRIAFLVVIALFAGAAVIAHWPARAQKSARSQADRRALAKKPAPSGTLKDRLAEDDGYGLVIFYSADIRGNLEVCGCPIHPLGGVARRMGYLDAFRRRSPDVPVVTVDAGHVFSDDLNADATALRADAELMNDWIVRANELMPLNIVNLSYRDLPYANQLLRAAPKLKVEKSALISANVKAGDARVVAPAPYVIKTIVGKRLKQPVRIAFIGVGDQPPDKFKASVAASGFVIDEPLAAVKAALAELRDKADVTVVVGYLNRRAVNRLAAQNDDLDVIINADGTGLIPDPMQLNNALVVYAAKETKHLGELRLYTDADGMVDRFTNRYVELDEVIPDQPQLAAVTKQARGEIDAVQTKMAEAEANAVAAKIAAEGAPPSPYATSDACAKCHVVEYEKWRTTRHAHAFAVLEERRRLFDADCVGCHAVGFRQAGFINVKATPQFANVQCESCHGPGAEHVAKPVPGAYPTPPAPASCVGCHDRDNSPDFGFDKYWQVVGHGKNFKPAAPKSRGGARRNTPHSK